MRSRAFTGLLTILLLLLFLPAAWAEEPSVTPPPPGSQYRTLKQGDTGYDVHLLKIRLYQLGYYNTANANKQFNGGLAKKIKEVQAANGLEQTGIATPELQLLIYSDDCVPVAGVTVPTPEPVVPAEYEVSGLVPELPALDSEGFLPEGQDGEYVYENEDEGVWYYISGSLYVEIRRFSVPGKHKLQWYETTVNLRGIAPEAYSVPYTKLTGSTFVTPVKLAQEHQVVLAISDDTYTWRTYYKRRTGIVVRNGELISNTPLINKKDTRFPPLDVMTFLPDGSMATYENGETTPEYLMSLGARNIYSFGPILLKNGREHLLVRYGGTSSKSKEPRCAIGMRSPNHFVVLTVNGRSNFSEGCTLAWLAERMKQLGANDAFNLDGGGSAALVFMGKSLNHKTAKEIRKITDIIGFGVSDLVEKDPSVVR